MKQIRKHIPPIISEKTKAERDEMTWPQAYQPTLKHDKRRKINTQFSS